MIGNTGCQTGVRPAMQAHTTEKIAIVLNGEHRTVPAGLNVLELLGVLDIPPSRVAVELNRSIVRKGEWESTVVTPGSQVEVVMFVGGG